MTHKELDFFAVGMGIIMLLLVLIFGQINNIALRLKERFPTSEEEDSQAHKKDRISK